MPDEELFTAEQLEEDEMALEAVASALARRIAEAPESTPALEILSLGGAKLDSTSGYVEISGAYRELAKAIHPDKLPDSTYANAAFRRINEAKNLLLPPIQPPAPPGVKEEVNLFNTSTNQLRLNTPSLRWQDHRRRRRHPIQPRHRRRRLGSPRPIRPTRFCLTTHASKGSSRFRSKKRLTTFVRALRPRARFNSRIFTALTRRERRWKKSSRRPCTQSGM
jgi:hypothetical protein